jgi:hypothetical protein
MARTGLLELEDELVELLLQLLVAVVDAQLLEGVRLRPKRDIAVRYEQCG